LHKRSSSLGLVNALRRKNDRQSSVASFSAQGEGSFNDTTFSSWWSTLFHRNFILALVGYFSIRFHYDDFPRLLIAVANSSRIREEGLRPLLLQCEKLWQALIEIK